MTNQMTSFNIPVQMYAACSTLGRWTPLWFRFEDETHSIETVKIEEVVSSKEENHCGIPYIRYVCWARTDSMRRLIELRYQISSHRWQFFKCLS